MTKSNLKSSKNVVAWRKLVGAAPLIKESRVRVWPMLIMVVSGLLFLMVRLTQLTIVEGAYQREMADDNRVAMIRTTANRGVFLDRNGKTLVLNKPLYKRQVPGTSLASVQFEELTREQALTFAYMGDERVWFDLKREYLCGLSCASLLGYTSEINVEELKDKASEYVLGDKVGKMGLEKMYEANLRGVPGHELVEANARGMAVRVIGKTESVSGHDLKITIDKDLMEQMYLAFGEETGAAVAQIPSTGEVLGIVSVPSFDPNNLADYLNAPNQPFFNRALMGAYAPGSVFKIVTAVAGMEEGKITKDTVFEDTGEIKIGEYRYGNWYYDEYGRTEGLVNVISALRRSNDIYFYKLGEAVGAQKLADWARRFGYGATSGLEALGERGGLIPDPNWKVKTKGEKWFLGNTYHMAIGQGDVATTPLQVNRVTAAIAANGVLCPVRLTQESTSKTACSQLSLLESTVDAVKEGMTQACSVGGTGAPFFHASYKVACKTGTAQQGGEFHDPHAWFTVYYPLQNPQIALTVMAEMGGQGSEVAAPIAKKVLDWWVEKRGDKHE